jgi:sugar lactone lactonase YvrE
MITAYRSFLHEDFMIKQKNQPGRLSWLQQQPQFVRVGVFVLLVIAVAVTVFSLTAFLYYQNLTNLPRRQAVAIREDLASVAEYVTISDRDAYPASVAVSPDGTLYTASYVSGTVWMIPPGGSLLELPFTRDRIGSVSALHYGLDGNLYILDHIAALGGGGGRIWRYGNELELLTTIAADDTPPLRLPSDLALDAAGYLYVIDMETRMLWRFDPDATSSVVWWVAPDGEVPAGLAYHPLRNSLLLTEATTNTIYEFALDATEPLPTVLYRYPEDDNLPGFNGISVAPDGRIFVGALDQNEVVEVLPETQELHYLAGAFRGSSDVAYDASANRLFVNNWDARWLLPVEFVFVRFYVDPRLPFGIDAVTLLDGE